MNASETLDKLIPALVTARAKFTTVMKDKTANVPTKDGKSYKYSYADLASVLDAVTPALLENGLVLVQPLALVEGTLYIQTRLYHQSGQWLGGDYPVPMAAKAQELGSAITYGRRYSATSLLGIVAEDDDDGAAASQDKPKAKTTPAPKPTEGPFISEAERKALRATAEGVFGAGYVPRIKALMLQEAGVADSSLLTVEGMNAVIRAIGREADREAERASIS